jgi:hypothetical protein
LVTAQQPALLYSIHYSIGLLDLQQAQLVDV